MTHGAIRMFEVAGGIILAVAVFCAIPVLTMFWRIITGHDAMTPEQKAETIRMMNPKKKMALSNEDVAAIEMRHNI